MLTWSLGALPALSLGLLQRLNPRLQSLDDPPQHGRELSVVKRQQLLPAPLRLPGDAAALQVLGQEAESVLLADVGPVVALRNGPVDDHLKLVQVAVPDVLLDLLVGEIVPAVGRGHHAVRLDDQGYLTRDAVLQPDLLSRRVEGAVASRHHLQLREAGGGVGVQLQRATPVLAVFFSTTPTTPPAGEWLTNTLLRHCVSSLSTTLGVVILIQRTCAGCAQERRVLGCVRPERYASR